ncbi:MAG TPA: lysophospholipid acyltransferase family protein [Symbiobacteriaceae bacterium]|nr:lysophospholipid acyltransferase family protein [Symbiobacteriaceae bacterium]
MYLYGFARGLVKIAFGVIYRIEVQGLENVPETGGAIVCGNHFNGRDPLIVGITMKRPISFMAKQELFQNKLFAWVIRGMGVFPVKRGQPDRAALKRSIDVLQSGTCFGIFPEGTRNKTGKLGKAEPGTAYLALKSGAPVIPVGISSSYKLFGRIIVKYGKPVNLEQYRDAKLTSEALEAVSDAIMSGIAAQLEPPATYEAAAGQQDAASK